MTSALYAGLREKDFFPEWFGYACVDAGYVPGRAGTDVSAFIHRKVWMENVTDIAWALRNTSEVELFTLVELRFDSVSEPGRGIHHDYNDCG